MKKYYICFFLLLGAVSVSLTAGFYLMRGRTEEPPVQTEEMTESETIPETETAKEDHIVINQEQVQPVQAEKQNFFLVSEDGFLLVFGSDRSEICLYTHIPITDFPEAERAKLRQGIWFSAMEEIYSYLESYTS